MMPDMHIHTNITVTTTACPNIDEDDKSFTLHSHS